MTQRFNFILIAILLATTHQEDKCKLLIDSWLKHPETLPAISYTDSGKFLNDLGDYNNCLYNKNQYEYFTITVINKVARGIQNIGLCAPLDCSQQIASNKFSKKIEEQLNEAFQNATNTTLVPFVNLNVYNPDTNKPQMDWSNYMVIAVVVFLIFLGVLGSVASLVTKSESKPVRVLKSFSIYENFMKVVTIPKQHQNQNLLFINGVRVLSISWIIYGHDMWFRLSNIKNWTESLEILTNPGITTLAPAAYFAVDTFFWVGGFMVTLGMLQQLKKVRNFTKFYIGSVIHRIIRIWPTYMLALFIFWKIAPFIGDGPIWRNFYNMTNACKNGGFLWNMFFIDNFGNHGPNGMDYCFGWGWYLAVDFQLFLITPFFLYAYHKNKKIGWIITFLLFLASVITAFVLIIVNGWRYPIPNPKFAPQPQFMDKFYYKPYVRASAYMMGIFTGFVYVEWKAGNEFYLNIINKIKNSVFIRVCFYVVGIILCESVIWVIVPVQKGEVWGTLTQAFYNSCNRIIFLIGVFLCCFSSMFGCKHDPTKYILGHWLFSPLAKVSFCMYLTHFIVILDGTFSVRMDLFWQLSTSLYIVITDIFYSILTATFLSLLVEAPILSLQRIFLRGDKSKSKQKQNKLELNKQQQLQEPLKDSFQTSVESVEIKTINNKQISLQNVKVSPQLDDTMIL